MKAFVAIFTLFHVFYFAELRNDAYSEAMGLAKRNEFIALNKETFLRLAKNPSRNFSTLVLFTANMPSRGCQACQLVHNEMSILATSYRKSKPNNQNLFIAFVDFETGSEIFQMMNLNTAPNIYLFTSKGHPRKQIQMDFSRVGFSAQGIAKFVKTSLGIQIDVVYPPDYSKFIIGSAVVLLSALILYLKPAILKIFTSYKFWIFCVLTGIYCMLSGQMWMKIHGYTTFAQYHADGSATYISDHSQMQYVVESYIVMLIYFGATLGLVVMADMPKLTKKTYINRRYIGLMGCVSFACIFGYQLSLLRFKYHGYPYSFLF